MNSEISTLPSSDSPPSSVLIEHVLPQLDGGRYPVKREVGDTLTVSADIFREGHDRVAAVLQYRRADAESWLETEMHHVGNDRWEGSFTLTENTRYLYTITAFPDVYETWTEEIGKKLGAGLDVSSELVEGIRIVEECLIRATREDAAIIQDAVTIASSEGPQGARVGAMLANVVAGAMVRHRTRAGSYTFERELRLTVDRVRARFAAWYSMFPRSAGTVEDQSATFEDVEAQLARISAMGFDVLYFTPIHPIGSSHRKGKNNTLHAQPDDPGVPYAIGSEDGGHFAIEPGLGTIESFRHLVAEADRYGMDIALDIALNASPDHPWVREHPEWFYIRPDGTIKYSENPPKKYEDIVPFNFGNQHWREQWTAFRDMMLFWVDNGVKAFRVDNPHTKPAAFWEWVIAEVQRDHPEIIFLSEAFTRPKVMKALAKAGFAQSYTYFTWRNFKQELIEYGTELSQSELSEYFRGNFFTNTHDILPYILQEGGRPAFQFRVVLAATMSSVYGIYSGFELCENTPVPGKEEYLNSEKYEYKVWDWDRPGNISAYIGRINEIRREHPALQEYDNLQFFGSSDENVLCYGKILLDRSDMVVIVLNLDPFHGHRSRITLPLEAFGIKDDGQYRAIELLSNETFLWSGSEQEVELQPSVNPAMIFSIQPWIPQDYIEPSY